MNVSTSKSNSNSNGNSYGEVPDGQLLPRIFAGDHGAFKALISRYHSPFIAMALANSLSHADAEEAVSDAFVKIWHSAGKYQDLGIEPKYWLRTLMRHTLLDKLRSLKRFAPELSATQIDESGDFLADDYGEGSHGSGENAMTPMDALESKQADACFDVCLLALSAAHRDTLQRCLLAGQSEATIAVETGQSLGTVKSRKHYAVRKMQGCVLECVNDHRSGSRKGASHG